MRRSRDSRPHGAHSSICPKEPGRWGQGLTAEKMKDCVWVKPELVAEIEFLEWTDANHLRHTSFVGLKGKQQNIERCRSAVCCI
jgi:ATP-dependent DNA ligase